MNRNGFTLFEMLCCVALMGFVLSIGLYLSKDTLGATIESLEGYSDNQVFKAANNYIIEKNINFNDLGYTCVTVSELIDYGYLKDVNDNDVKNRIVKIVRNNDTKVITNTSYVDKCE